jgi:HEAT repeat protein
MGDPRAVEPLMETLSKANKFVRRASAYALGLLKDPRSVDILISALKDEDPIVSRAAAGALWQIGSPAVDSLIRALEEKNTSVKFSSIIALGLIRDQRAMPALEKLLDHTQKEIEKKTLDSEELSKMKNLITESLELIKGEKSISQLMESPDDKELLERVLHVD